MTGPGEAGPSEAGRSEVDPAVLAGEPDSVRVLEGGDEDLLSAQPADDDAGGPAPGG